MKPLRIRAWAFGISRHIELFSSCQIGRTDTCHVVLDVLFMYTKLFQPATFHVKFPQIRSQDHANCCPRMLHGLPTPFIWPAKRGCCSEQHSVALCWLVHRSSRSIEQRRFAVVFSRASRSSVRWYLLHKPTEDSVDRRYPGCASHGPNLDWKQYFRTNRVQTWATLPTRPSLPSLPCPDSISGAKPFEEDPSQHYTWVLMIIHSLCQSDHCIICLEMWGLSQEAFTPSTSICLQQLSSLSYGTPPYLCLMLPVKLFRAQYPRLPGKKSNSIERCTNW